MDISQLGKLRAYNEEGTFMTIFGHVEFGSKSTGNDLKFLWTKVMPLPILQLKMISFSHLP